ncbi:MAG: hypothetical protein IJA62_03780 [Ruminococcus sp.]|nr:hypothetical protein [Ruminococcus sp.]
MTTKKTFSKRAISLLLTLLMVLSLVPLSDVSTSAATASASGFTVNIPHITRTIYYGNTTDVYNASLFDPERLSLGISNDTLYASITFDDRYSMNPDHKYYTTSIYSVTPFPCTSQWSDNGYAVVIGKQAGESRMDISGGHWNWGRDEYTWRAEFTYTPFSSHNYATSDNPMYYTVDKAATCTSTGTATARCTNGVCNSYKTITLPIDPNNHNWGGWTQYGDSQHIRRCRNSGCNATQTANCAGKSYESLACGEYNACTTCGRVLSDTPAQHTAFTWSATSDSFVSTCFRCSTEIKAQLVSDETSYVYTGSPIKPLKLECTELYSFPNFEIVYDQNTTDVRDGVKGSVTYKNALVGLEFVNNQIVSKTQDLTISKTFNIVPADAKFTAPSAKEVNYNGRNQQLVTAGSTENGTLLYSLDNESWSEDIPTAKEEGTYKVYYKVVGDANHNDTEVFSVEATISPCSHQGGTATCKNRAVCEICSAEYGDIDKNNHAGELENGFCTECGGFEPAKLNADGYYEIANAGQLYWFADKVNNDNNNFNSVRVILTDNIVVNEGEISADSKNVREWIPIGTSNRNRFRGVFFGNNKTISGLYCNNENYDLVGLFGYSEATIACVGVVNSYFSSSAVAGGIVGCYAGGRKIENCYSTSIVSSPNAGGIVGHSLAKVKVNNCYFAGEVTGTNVGGIVGYFGEDFTGTVTNCYYLDTTCSGGIYGSDSEGSAEAKTAEQFANGEVAYLLQSNCEEQIWGQKLGEENYPLFSENKVYKNRIGGCVEANFSYEYSNTQEDETTTHPGQWTPNCKWDPNASGDCYVYIDLYCADCEEWVDSVSGDAELLFETTPINCQNPGSREWSFNFTILDREFTETYTQVLKSDVHTDIDENGFCSECGGYQPATLNDNGTPDDEWDDYYEISNAGQLYWFGEVAVANDNYSRAVLTDDIIVNEDLNAENLREWIPIGESSSMPYCGTFDGQGHSISGLYAKSELNYIGLFGAIGWGAEISNLGIKDSYFEGNYYVGGIAGYNDFSYIKNCYAENVEIVTVSSGAAVVGYNYGEVSNSYSTSDSFVGNNNYGTITNCYYLAGEEIHDEDGLTFKTAEQFNSGEVAYLLQSGVVGEEIWDDELGEYVQTEPEHIWGQKIGEDTYPVFGGDKVYQVENCIGELAYSNANENGKHNFVNGFCTVCGGYEPATLNEDGVYEIGNAGQLYWFAESVNSGNTSANAILTADIVVNEGVMTSESTDARAWTPIGNTDYMYTGTFDGNNKTVSGLYFNNAKAFCVGLFGRIGENGAVKNTGVINSYFKGLSAVGGVVGSNNGTITNCYNSGVVSSTFAIGGVVGVNEGTITSCYNTGIIEGNEFVGGVTGTNYSGTITNCYNTGEVSGSYEVGGVVGKISEGIISNCYNTGEVSGANDYIGGVAGANQTGTITNCYYLDTAYEGGIGMNDTTKAEDIVGSAEAKTAEQFKGGEVAYLLQGTQTEEIWGQKIGTDELPVLGGDKVYAVKDSQGNITGYTNTVQTDNLEGYTIGLGDKIAVNYYMSLTEETLNDANAKMVFTVPDTGSTYTVEIPVSEAVKSGDYYVFTCEVAAKEMTSVIKAKLITSESELQLDDYTVQEYAEVILSDTVKYAKEQELVKKMLNYGAQAQIYFNYNTDNLANDTELMTAEEKAAELFGFAGAPFTLEGEESGVTYYGTALSLKTELAFKHYFIIDEGVDAQSLEISCDYPATLKKNGNLYVLTISDIPAHMMGANSLKVSLGGITLDYTIYSYGALAQNAGKEELWAVVSALAHFANTASEYTYK